MAKRHSEFESLEPRILWATTPVPGALVRPPRDFDTIWGGTSLAARAVSPIQIDLDWQTQPVTRSSAGFAVERAPIGQPFITIATVGAGARHYSDLGLVSNSGYSYRVRDLSSNLATNDANATTKKYDAGLLAPFQSPAPVTGQTRNILSFGATPNDSSNDDATAIKNAITAASAGDEVYIPNGVYHIKSRDIRLKTGVSIRGQSMSGAILSAVFTDAGVDNPNSQMFRALPGVNNFTLSNFRIEMTGGQSLEYGLYLGSGSTGVANVSRIAVKNVNIEGFAKFAVAIRNGDNLLVQDCLLRNATALGGGGEGYGVMIGYDNSFNNWITGNTIGPIIRHALVVQYRAHHNLIEHNTAIDTTLDCYDLHGEDEYSNEIRYNVARGSGGFGVGIGNTGATHVNSGPFNWIHHNEVYDSRGGVNVILGSDTQYIEDNNFHDNSQQGILVNNGGGRGLWFLRNTVRFNGGAGAQIDDAPNLVMIDNVITNNASSGLIAGATTTNYSILRNDFRANGAAVQLASLLGVFADNLI
jgi:hypothetical protein